MERVTAGMPAPYMGSLQLYRQWLHRRIEGFDDAGAWHVIAASMPRAERRRVLPRTTVAGASGQQPLTLSVPMAGGSSVLKRGRPEEWRLSMHGRWQAVHLGALEAAYGAMPFYSHVVPELKKSLEATYEGMPFGQLTDSIHRLILRTLDIEPLLPELARMRREDAARLQSLADEKNQGCHTDFTILDVIFRKGPEGIFTLLRDILPTDTHYDI